MGKSVAQKALCLPVPQQVTPSCPAAPGGCFPGVLLPVLCMWLEGKGTGGIKPRENRAPGPLLTIVLHQEEEGRLPATADWVCSRAQSHPLVPYTCFSSLEKPHKEQRDQTPFSLHAPAPLSTGHWGYQVAHQVLSHLQHPPKLRLLYPSCPLYPKHFSSFREASKDIWATVGKKDWRNC